MNVLSSNVGRKLVMSLTGLMLTLFVIIHLFGNSTIFGGRDWLNAYAEHLHALPPLVWVFRIAFATVFFVHIYYGINLTLENQSAKPQRYAVAFGERATFASKNMIWTGLAILAFVGFHLIHFTFQFVSPEISANLNLDSKGRHDVFGMVTGSFAHGGMSALYVIASVVLAVHLYHGIQSALQTLGIMCSKIFDEMTAGCRLVAVAIGVAYVMLPLAVFLGFVSKY